MSGLLDAPVLHVLVVDDDPDACRQASALVGAADVNGVVVGTCATVAAATAALAAVRVDVVVLDVCLAGGDGFAVVEAVGVGRMPPTVCCAHSPAAALRAFEAGAIDYLVKPYSDARFGQALRRARRQAFATRAACGPEAEDPCGADRRGRPAPRPPASPPTTTAVPPALPASSTPPAAPYPDALAVRAGAQYLVLRVPDIDWAEADGNHVRLHTRGRSRLITRSLAALERDVLDPATFVRVHRSAIVNVSRIAAAEPLAHGELTLTLHGGAQVDCSRRYRARLEARLYFTT